MIHDLSFGPKYPRIHNPLDDTSRILRDTSGTFKYYIKVLVCIIMFFLLLASFSLMIQWFKIAIGLVQNLLVSKVRMEFFLLTSTRMYPSFGLFSLKLATK
jgi:hypothetical protein